MSKIPKKQRMKEHIVEKYEKIEPEMDKDKANEIARVVVRNFYQKRGKNGKK